jgi:hypothetical protein
MLSMADLLHRMVLFLKQKEFLNYNVLNLLRYKTNFGAHGFEALVAHENNKLTNSFLSAYRTNLFDPNGLGLNNAIVQQNSNSYIEGSLKVTLVK